MIRDNVIKFPAKEHFQEVAETGILNRAAGCPICGKKLFYIVGINDVACYKCKSELKLESK